jgi:hypothetical protein
VNRTTCSRSSRSPTSGFNEAEAIGLVFDKVVELGSAVRPQQPRLAATDRDVPRRHPDRSAPRLGLRFAVANQDTDDRLSFS